MLSPQEGEEEADEENDPDYDPKVSSPLCSLNSLVFWEKKSVVRVFGSNTFSPQPMLLWLPMFCTFSCTAANEIVKENLKS